MKGILELECPCRPPVLTACLSGLRLTLLPVTALQGESLGNQRKLKVCMWPAEWEVNWKTTGKGTHGILHPAETKAKTETVIDITEALPDSPGVSSSSGCPHRWTQGGIPVLTKDFLFLWTWWVAIQSLGHRCPWYKYVVLITIVEFLWDRISEAETTFPIISLPETNATNQFIAYTQDFKCLPE